MRKKAYITGKLLGVAILAFSGITLINDPSLANPGSINVGWLLLALAVLGLTLFIPQKTWDTMLEKFSRSYS